MWILSTDNSDDIMSFRMTYQDTAKSLDTVTVNDIHQTFAQTVIEQSLIACCFRGNSTAFFKIMVL